MREPVEPGSGTTLVPGHLKSACFWSGPPVHQWRQCPACNQRNPEDPGPAHVESIVYARRAAIALDNTRSTMSRSSGLDLSVFHEPHV
jgi:hypothetical protein